MPEASININPIINFILMSITLKGSIAITIVKNNKDELIFLNKIIIEKYLLMTKYSSGFSRCISFLITGYLRFSLDRFNPKYSLACIISSLFFSLGTLTFFLKYKEKGFIQCTESLICPKVYDIKMNITTCENDIYFKILIIYEISYE